MAKYPMDIDDLELGSIIEPATIERVMGVKRNDPDYRRHMMGLAEFIESEWVSLHGYPCTIKYERESLHVLTHEGAALENEKRTRRSRRAWARAIKRGRAVDVSALSAPTKERHEGFLYRSTRAFAMSGKEMRRRKLIPEPVKRDQLPPAASKDSE